MDNAKIRAVFCENCGWRIESEDVPSRMVQSDDPDLFEFECDECGKIFEVPRSEIFRDE